MIWSNRGTLSKNMDSHRHDMHEFFVCMNDYGIQYINKDSCHFQRGRAFMLYSGLEHHLQVVKDGNPEFIFVCFDKNHLAKSGYLQVQGLLEKREKQGCYFSGTEEDYLKFNLKTISHLHKETSSSGLLQNELIDALLVQLLVEFLRNTNPGTSIAAEVTSKVAKLCRQAALDSSIDMTLEQAARKTGTCRSAFAKQVKEITGFSWREYILDCRLKKSFDLLATTNIQILQIALKCNFNNIAYFHRTFLNKYGKTPGKMRKILQQNRFPHIIKEY